MIERSLFSPEHELFRESLTRFLEREVAPKLEDWEARGGFDRNLFLLAGEEGFLCPTMPVEYGGSGADVLYSALVLEAGAPYSNFGLPLSMHSEIVANYLLHFGSGALKQKYLPEMASGHMIGALAMTEPSTGSDVKAIRTTAVREGDHFVLTGSKTFISNATVCDLVIVVAKTDATAGAKGISLFVVDAIMTGFSRGKPLKKIGMKSQDTGELFFDQVRVPVENLIGEENKGFVYLMTELPWERLQIAISAIAVAEAALAWTIDYVRERKAFGQAVIEFQNTRFKLAELKSEIQIGRVFVDRCLQLLMDNKLDATTASMAKYWCSDLQCKVVDECLQLHGGYGYMWEYPIGRAYVDSRAQRIYGGTNEIMKELIARDL
jgi:alkylation response protein AidB-like acyl-CoA dehydrogenase